MTCLAATCRQWHDWLPAIGSDMTGCQLSAVTWPAATCRQWHDWLPAVGSDMTGCQLSAVTWLAASCRQWHDWMPDSDTYPLVLSTSLKLDIDNYFTFIYFKAIIRICGISLYVNIYIYIYICILTQKVFNYGNKYLLLKLLLPEVLFSLIDAFFVLNKSFCYGEFY